MSARRLLAPTSLALIALALAACGDDQSHDTANGHDHGADHDEHGDAADPSFKEGRGLELSPEIIHALELRTAEAAERAMTPTIVVPLQIVRLRPNAEALARVIPAETDGLRLGQTATLSDVAGRPLGGEATLRAIDRSTEHATAEVELVFTLTAPPKGLAPGDGLIAHLQTGEARAALVVPRSAVLETAAGPVVYVVNGGAYLRTEVRLGAATGEFVEITDGLYAGDTVVASPVNQLWLVELRLTKGGGHSH